MGKHFSSSLETTNMPSIVNTIISVSAILTMLLLCDGCDVTTTTLAEANGSFEILKNGLPINWTFNPASFKKEDLDLKLDTTNPKDGKQALEFDVYHCSDVGGVYSPGIFQVIRITPGHTYKTTFWIKNRGCKFLVRLSCNKGYELGHVSKVLETSDSMDTWTKFEFLSPTYKNEIGIRFELNILGPGTLWIDDIRIEEVTNQ